MMIVPGLTSFTFPAPEKPAAAIETPAAPRQPIALLPAPPKPLLLPAPPPLTAEQKARRAAEKILGQADASLSTLAGVQNGLDVAITTADGVLRRMDQASIALTRLASGRGDQQDWQAARQQVAGVSETAIGLGNSLALQAGALDESLKTLEYAQANLWNADKKVQKQTKPSGELCTETMKRVPATVDVLMLTATKSGVALAQAIAAMNAPFSQAQAEVAAKAIGRSRWMLEIAVEQSDDMHLALYTARADGQGFRDALDAALQGKPGAAAPTTYAELLSGLETSLKDVGPRLDVVDQGYGLAASAAAPIRKQVYEVKDALRQFAGSAPEERAAARQKAQSVLGAMRSNVTNLEQVLFGGSRRRISDTLAPIWKDVSAPGARLATLDSELRAKDDENALWFFGRQYARIHDALGEGAQQGQRGCGLVGSGMRDALELPRRLQELTRRLDNCRALLNEDPEVAGPALKDEIFRLDRLARDVTIGFPDNGSLLQNAAHFIGIAVSGLHDAAEVAKKKGV
ncbi:MAG: hypothetical protein FJX76_22605 [Armatimonadetes bacterium]|nr:hypothetical protein [Armatimonadota bacterium]